ncbi:MAG: RagB/SusD family nutrient uptake outer membrane protein [Bacteroidota bacterium]
MKNSIYKILALLVIGLIVGCKDYLDVTPESQFESDSFYSSPQEAEIALAGIYGVIASDQGYGRDLPVIADAGTDETFYNRRFNENWGIALYRNTPADDESFNIWTNQYQAINLANLFIESIEPANFETEEQFNALLAEARFLRALCYFNLSNLWEEVPLRLSSSKNQEDNNEPAASLAEIYEAIIEDFEFATQNLPHPTDPLFTEGRAHKLAAHGLLARVYLKMSGFPLKENRYAEALAHADSVISDGFHALRTSNDTTGYELLFKDLIGGPYDAREVLFEISFQNLRDIGLLDVDGRHGNINGINFGSNSTLGDPNGFAQTGVYPGLANLFNQNLDKRYLWNIATFKRNSAGNIFPIASELAIRDFCPAKFRRWEPANFEDIAVDSDDEAFVELELDRVGELNRNFTNINFPVLRYSDVLLMYAEAANEVSGGPTALGLQYFNEVRNRAGLWNLEDSASTSAIAADQQLFFEELVDERSRELCFEGLRRFDLVRWELLEEKLIETKAIVEGHPDFSANNEDHLSTLRPAENFNPAIHLSLPYPLVEVTINQSLDQKDGW